MCKNREWTTDDPLGIGGLLSDACRLTQLIIKSGIGFDNMLKDLLQSADRGLHYFMQSDPMKMPPEYRLAFRELGLVIGMHGVGIMKDMIRLGKDRLADARKTEALVAKLSAFQPVAENLEDFWLAPEHQKVGTWNEHLNINSVMLATSLIPEGFLLI